jgi:hypothetical protein
LLAGDRHNEQPTTSNNVTLFTPHLLFQSPPSQTFIFILH